MCKEAQDGRVFLKPTCHHETEEQQLNSYHKGRGSCLLLYIALKLKTVFAFFNSWKNVKRRTVFLEKGKLDEIEMSVFFIKFYWNTTMTICRQPVWGCFPATRPELNTCDTDGTWLTKPDIFTI